MKDDGLVAYKRRCSIDWKQKTFQSAVDPVCYEWTEHKQAVAAAAAWYHPSIRAYGIWQFVFEMPGVIYSVKENSPLLKDPHKFKNIWKNRCQKFCTKTLGKMDCCRSMITCMYETTE